MNKILVGIPVLDNIEMTRACIQSLYQYTDSDKMDVNMVHPANAGVNSN
jgi:hypothetical protein